MYACMQVGQQHTGKNGLSKFMKKPRKLEKLAKGQGVTGGKLVKGLASHFAKISGGYYRSPFVQAV